MELEIPTTKNDDGFNFIPIGNNEGYVKNRKNKRRRSDNESNSTGDKPRRILTAPRKNIKKDLKAISDMTIAKLMSSKGKFKKSYDTCDNFNAIHIELLPEVPNTCSFCYRTLCDSCKRTCGICEYLFCPLCSNSNYEAQVDRHLCLECEKKQRSKF